MSFTVTVAAITTIGLPAQVLVTQTRSDLIRVVPHLNRHGKMSKEVIVKASFKEMLRKGIICASPVIPVNIRSLYPEAPQA